MNTSLCKTQVYEHKFMNTSLCKRQVYEHKFMNTILCKIQVYVKHFFLCRSVAIQISVSFVIDSHVKKILLYHWPKKVAWSLYTCVFVPIRSHYTK